MNPLGRPRDGTPTRARPCSPAGIRSRLGRVRARHCAWTAFRLRATIERTSMSICAPAMRGGRLALLALALCAGGLLGACDGGAGDDRPELKLYVLGGSIA